MELFLEQAGLAQRARWLVRLRWVAVAFLAGATFAAGGVFGVSLHQSALYWLAACLLTYNALMYVTLRRIARRTDDRVLRGLNRIIILQASADLFILTAILYFSGGIENPFSFFFVFHMIIVSTLMSRKQSYLQAAMAVTLYGALLLAEYMGWVRHYPLTGFVPGDLHTNGRYVLGVFFVFCATLFLVVYMTTSIVALLRAQQSQCLDANLLLHQKDRIKNEYILHVTHDIKAHLAAVKSLLDVVVGEMLGPLPGQQGDMIRRADQRTEKCILFVESLLKLTRMRLAGKIDMAEFSLRNVVVDSIASVEDKATARGHDLAYELDPRVDRIWGSQIMIEDAITNLLHNAIKYTPDGGRIRLVTRDEADSVVIEISDTGIGIPADETDKVFDEFYRGQNARQAVHDGTGLGLSLTREIVVRHHGQIRVESSPQRGSTFSVRLPKSPPNTGM